MYKVIIRKRAQKDLKKLTKRGKDKILVALVKLRSEPFLGKKLVGELRGYYSLRVWPYRIIYKVYKKRLIVYVVDVGHRQGIYKRS